MARYPDTEGFEALIKPIQDITRLDIDLCRSLEEYISHILSIEISPGTFAEAALLVQNSAAIYSKKVDSLWTTVLQLLEALSKSKPCSSCGGLDCEEPCEKRKRKHRQNQATEGADGENVEGEGSSGAARKKRPLKNVIATEELQLVNAICSDRLLNVKENKLSNDTDKYKRIVLNASIKVKTDHNVMCPVRDSTGEIMGKKDEFRLHWKISSNGTLHEEFVNSHSTKTRREADVFEDSFNIVADNSIDPAPFDDGGTDFQMQDESIFPTPPEMSEDVPVSECIEENEFGAGAQRQTRKENIVNLEDIRKKAWEPVSFDVNMPEKVLRKRNALKVPETLQESGQENRKRKRTVIEMNVDSFLVVDWLIEKHLKSDKVNKYLNAYEILKSIQTENKLKRQVMMRRRKAYQEIVINEASKEYEGEFEGFPDMDADSDDDEDNGGFNGFVDLGENNDFCGDDLNVPLPENNDFHSNNFNHDKEIPVNDYETEALKTLHEYQQRHKDDQRLSGLQERVSAWHHLIRPKLEIAETRSHFDIHEYGTRILDKFPENSKSNNIKMFSECVAGLPREEVARNFLSCLCLANTSNLELTKADPAPMSMDCLQLRLISRVRHHEEMHDNMQNATS